jgi:hypothetical protein
MLHKWMIGVSAVFLAGIGAGCQNYPEVPAGDQMGMKASATSAGATIPSDNGLLAGLVGGTEGKSGGYVVGADWSKIRQHASPEALAAAKKAESNPASAAEVKQASTADINQDGFITLDEIVALQQAGLSDREIVDRMEQTRAYFEVTKDQEQYLRDHAVKPAVVKAMKSIDDQNEAQTAAAEIGPAAPSK